MRSSHGSALLFLLPAIAAQAAHALQPKQPPPSGATYSYVGCYADASVSRRLPVALIGSDNWTVSVDACFRAAIAQNLKYFGVQSGRQCFGGTDLTYAKALGTSARCNMPCAGNRNQTCGGVNANGIYKVAAGRMPPSPRRSPPPPRMPPPRPPPRRKLQEQQEQQRALLQRTSALQP